MAPRSSKSAPVREGVRVRAVQKGYYGEARRRIGDVFTLEKPEDFSDADTGGWMERVHPETPERVTTGQQEIRQKHDEIIAGKKQDGLQVGPDDATGNANPLGS